MRTTEEVRPTTSARKIDIWVPLDADADDLVEVFSYSPGSWLPRPAEGRGPAHWSVTLHAGPIVRPGTCGLGVMTGNGEIRQRRLVWQPDLETADDGSQHRALPSFEGALVLRAADRRGDLGIEGVYEPPTGAIGASLNPEQIQAMAEVTAANFLRDTAAGLVERAG